MISYRRDIDGLRAVAVLCVVIYHLFSNFLPGGFIGVDVFFVISGFLITQIIQREAQAGKFSFAGFYRRRILRIFPSLIVVLTTSLIAGIFIFDWSGLEHLGKHIFAGALFFSNFALWSEGGYFDIAAERKPLLHLWSLSIEEQFYLVWPVIVLLIFRRRLNFFLVATVVGIASFLLSAYQTHADTLAGFYNPAGRFWELLLGSALGIYTASDRYRPPSLLYSAAMSLAGLICIAASCLSLNRESIFPGLGALTPCLGTALILAVNPSNTVSRIALTNPLMVGIGLISYPLYLWHWPLWSIAYSKLSGEVPLNARIIIGLGSLVLAYLSYRLVERPLRFGPNKPTKVLWLVVGMLALALTGLISWRSEGFIKFSNVVTEAPFLKRSRNINDWFTAVRMGACHLQDGNAKDHANYCLEQQRPMLVLWGDSHAASLYPGLKKLKTEVSFGLTQWTQAACPPFQGSNSKHSKACDQINQRILSSVRELQPEIIVLGAAWIHPDYKMTNQEIALKVSDAVRSIKALAPKAHIVVMGCLPRWGSQNTSPNGLPAVLKEFVTKYRRIPPLYLPRPITPESEPLAELDNLLESSARSTGATFISPVKAFCDRSGCLTRVEDSPDGLISFDTAHLNPLGSEYLLKKIKGRIFGE